jgi:maleate isomerase
MSLDLAPSQLGVTPVDVAYELDEGYGPRGRIGLIALATDATCEHDLRTIFPGDVALYVSRVANADQVSMASLQAMESGLQLAAAEILPGGRLDVMAYGCTSGTAAIGEENIFAYMRESRPGIPCTTPMTAAIKGLKAVGARNVCLLTPYNDEITVMVRDLLEAGGVSVLAMASFGELRDSQTARVPARAIHEAAMALDVAEADGIFVSCTALRSAQAAAGIEAALGKPVVASNQALAWDCLRLAGYTEPVPGYGRLLEI